MKIAIISLLSLTIGLLIGSQFFPVEKVETKIVGEKTSDPEVKVITKTEYKKDKEAEAFYGKAFALFLANLGLKLDKEKEENLKELLENPKEYLAVTKRNPETEVYIPREIDFNPTSWFKEFIQKENANLKHINDDALIKDAQEFMLKDPALFHARSTFIKKFPILKLLLGEYKGNLYRIAGNNRGRRDDIYLNIDFQLKEEDKVDGSFTLKLSADGETYSNSSGRGGNGDVKIKNDSILIQAGPGSFFHFKGKSIDVANFYSNGKLVGLARFTKQ